MLHADPAKGLQLGGIVEHPRGVGGVVQNEKLRPGSDGGLQGLRLEQEALLLLRVQDHRSAAGHAHGLGIGHPIGSGDDGLVPRIHQAAQGDVDAVLCTAGNDDLLRGVLHPQVGGQPGADGLLQGREAGGRGILGFAVPDGLDGRLLDVVRRIEIRLAGPEVDHVLALRLQAVGQVAHR